MKKRKYDFTSYDLEYKRKLEKKRGSNIPDDKFYRYVQKQKKWLGEFAEAVKKWMVEKPYEAEQLSRLVKSWEERDKNKEPYDRLAKIKKLPIAGLFKLLSSILEKEGYIKLDFSKPEMGRGVIVQFTVQDDKSDREEYDSKTHLKMILQKGLESTNWQLMSDSISYHLGVLTGRLRGFELEEDLIKLIRE